MVVGREVSSANIGMKLTVEDYMRGVSGSSTTPTLTRAIKKSLLIGGDGSMSGNCHINIEVIHPTVETDFGYELVDRVAVFACAPFLLPRLQLFTNEPSLEDVYETFVSMSTTSFLVACLASPSKCSSYNSPN